MFLQQQEEWENLEIQSLEGDFDEEDNEYCYQKLKKKAVEYIDLFFQNKSDMFGNPVNISKIINDENNIKLVINTVDVVDGISYAYEILSLSGINTTPPKGSMLSDDVKLVLGVLEECATLKIPKSSAGGLLLLYLNYCYKL